MGLEQFFGIKFFEFTYVVTLCLVPYILITSSVRLYVCAVVVLYVCLRNIRERLSRNIRAKGQGVLITGCDTGFGHDLARRLDTRGFTVFAGCLRPDGEGATKLKAACSERLHVVAMDVTSDDSVAQAHEYIRSHLPTTGLWGIVNNAGLNVMGDVEWCTVKLYHKCLNVNLYGAIRTLRTFLYMVRNTKGRVVVVSSVKGRHPWPADSAYHVSKAGLETLTDSLRMEMIKFGVKVSIVEPGAFDLATACQDEAQFKRYEEEVNEMWDSATDEVKSTYGRHYIDALIAGQRASVNKKGISASSTDPVIDALETALVSDRPQARYMVPGGTGLYDPYTVVARIHGFLPTSLSDWIITRFTGCDKFPDPPVDKSK